MKKKADKIKINGTVASGFESVKDLFEKEMHEKAEDGVQLCVYHKGKQVVDLWASASNDERFTADSLMIVFSSGKSLECLGIAHLVDKGLLNYSDKIAQHWPEFGQKGKEDITVAELMRHESGLQKFDVSLEPEDLLPENLNKNNVGRIIENETVTVPRHSPYKRIYHAQTRGWIVNELFRRVEPNGRTLGQYLREDIAIPLGADAYVGIKEEEFSRRYKLSAPSFFMQLWESLKPAPWRKQVASSIYSMLFTIPRVIGHTRKVKQWVKANREAKLSVEGATPQPKPSKKKRGRVKPVVGMNESLSTALGFYNKPLINLGESSSFAANCSARGLAKIAAVMAGGGKFENREYFSHETWQAIHANKALLPLGLGSNSNFSQGGVNHFLLDPEKATPRALRLYEGRKGFYGWMGVGGSIFQWHIELDIGFAFVPNAMHLLDGFNERGMIYQAEVMKCAKRLSA